MGCGGDGFLWEGILRLCGFCGLSLRLILEL